MSQEWKNWSESVDNLMIFKDEMFVVSQVIEEDWVKVLHLMHETSDKHGIYPILKLKGSWKFTPVIKGNKLRVIGEFTN